MFEQEKLLVLTTAVKNSLALIYNLMSLQILQSFQGEKANFWYCSPFLNWEIFGSLTFFVYIPSIHGNLVNHSPLESLIFFKKNLSVHQHAPEVPFVRIHQSYVSEWKVGSCLSQSTQHVWWHQMQVPCSHTRILIQIVILLNVNCRYCILMTNSFLIKTNVLLHIFT